MPRAPLAGFKGRITIFGCGTMAGAMLSRWLATGLDPARVTAIRASGAPAAPGVATQRNGAGLAAPDILLIGVKPQAFPGLAPAIAALAGPETLAVSIMAGVALDDLAAALPDAGGIVRAMPSMPVASGDGIVATVATDGAPHARALAALLAPLGQVQRLADEAAFDAVTALTGCGPAFVYRFVAAMAGAAVRLGLDPADADRLARATVAGAARVADASPEAMGALADAVASPGGMTQAGLDILDSDGRLAALMSETLRAARDRGRALAAAARGD